MLVLTRKPNESIRIGDIKVMIVDVRGERVRIGIEAPPHVAVHREEIYEAIKKTTDIVTDKLPSVHFNGTEPYEY